MPDQDFPLLRAFITVDAKKAKREIASLRSAVKTLSQELSTLQAQFGKGFATGAADVKKTLGDAKGLAAGIALSPNLGKPVADLNKSLDQVSKKVSSLSFQGARGGVRRLPSLGIAADPAFGRQQLQSLGGPTPRAFSLASPFQGARGGFSARPTIGISGDPEFQRLQRQQVGAIQQNTRALQFLGSPTSVARIASLGISADPAFRAQQAGRLAGPALPPPPQPLNRGRFNRGVRQIADRSLFLGSGGQSFGGRGGQQNFRGISLPAIFGAFATAAGVRRTFQLAKGFEQVSFALGKLTGEGPETVKLFRELETLALSTTTNLLTDLLPAAQRLIGSGFGQDEVEPLLRQLADLSIITQANGVSFNRLVGVVARNNLQFKLLTRDVREFTNAGLNVLPSLQRQLGAADFEEVFDRIRKGEVTIKNLLQAINDLTSRGGIAFNLQADALDTAFGSVEKLSESFQLFIKDIGTKFLPEIKVLARDAADFFNALRGEPSGPQANRGGPGRRVFPGRAPDLAGQSDEAFRSFGARAGSIFNFAFQNEFVESGISGWAGELIGIFEEIAGERISDSIFGQETGESLRDTARAAEEFTRVIPAFTRNRSVADFLDVVVSIPEAVRSALDTSLGVDIPNKIKSLGDLIKEEITDPLFEPRAPAFDLISQITGAVLPQQPSAFPPGILPREITISRRQRDLQQSAVERAAQKRNLDAIGKAGEELGKASGQLIIAASRFLDADVVSITVDEKPVSQ